MLRYEVTELIKSPRPRVLGGITVKVETGCGNMYVQMNWCKNKPFEVFATLGHSGSCASAESEALTRSITLGLRCGIHSEEYARELKGIQCPNPRPFPKENAVMSCPDAIGKVVEEFGSWTVTDLVELLKRVNSVEDAQPEDEEAQAKVALKRLAEERERAGLNA